MSAPDETMAACLSPDELAAWVAGAVEAGARQRALDHVERCAACRESASLLAQLEPSQDARPARTPDTSEPARETPGAEAAQLAVVGETIGRFRVKRVLGRGGMGIVLLAHDEELERDVALKLMLTDEVGKSAKQSRLAGEAKALAALDHPNLVSVFEVGEHRGLPFLVMELVDGVTLRTQLALEKPPWREGLRHCLAASAGIAALHDAGFIDRDIKPDNVMLARDGRVVVVDLGLAKRAARRGSQPPEAAPTSVRTGSGVVVGTPRYLAPERIAGKPADVQSDVYAFAAMTLEMVRACAGKPPARVVTVLSRGLDPDPASRFGSIPALAEALRSAARSQRDLAIGAGAAVALAAAAIVVLGREAAPAADSRPTVGAPAAMAERATSSRPSPAIAAVVSAPLVAGSARASASSASAVASARPSVSVTATATVTGTASVGVPWVSGPAASAGSAWIRVDPTPMPPAMSVEWMKRMGSVPTTYEDGYQAVIKGYESDCRDPEKDAPWGVDWGVVERIGRAEPETEKGDKVPMWLVAVKGQRKRYVFDAQRDGTYLDAAPGSWVFFCPGAPGKMKLPDGWSGDFSWTRAFGPIKGPPVWAAAEYLKDGPRLRAPPGDKLEVMHKPFVWRDGDGPFIFGVTRSQAADAAKGTVDMGSYFLEADAKSRNVAQLGKAAKKNPVFVIASLVRMQKKEDVDRPVVRIDEVLPSLFTPPDSARAGAGARLNAPHAERRGWFCTGAEGAVGRGDRLACGETARGRRPARSSSTESQTLLVRFARGEVCWRCLPCDVLHSCSSAWR